MSFTDNPNYDPEIDHAYMPSKWSNRSNVEDEFVTYMTKESNNLRSSHEKWIEVIKYGKGPKQKMEIIKKPDLPEDAPMVVYIHGGYWVETDREIYLICVETAVKREHIGVVVGYDQAPDVCLTTMMNEIRDAYIFLSKKYPCCPSITLFGHSAGGHLSSMLMATNWEEYDKSETKLIPVKRLINLAPILDLRPVIHISYNSQLHLTDEEVKELSPLQQIERSVSNMKKFRTKVISMVGEYDPPTFKEKAKEYTEILKKNSIDSSYVELSGQDHYEPLQKIREPDSLLAKLILGEEE